MNTMENSEELWIPLINGIHNSSLFSRSDPFFPRLHGGSSLFNDLIDGAQTSNNDGRWSNHTTTFTTDNSTCKRFVFPFPVVNVVLRLLRRPSLFPVWALSIKSSNRLEPPFSLEKNGSDLENSEDFYEYHRLMGVPK